jgi:hypothetical protein
MTKNIFWSKPEVSYQQCLRKGPSLPYQSTEYFGHELVVKYGTRSPGLHTHKVSAARTRCGVRAACHAPPAPCSVQARQPAWPERSPTALVPTRSHHNLVTVRFMACTPSLPDLEHAAWALNRRQGFRATFFACKGLLFVRVGCIDTCCRQGRT